MLIFIKIIYQGRGKHIFVEDNQDVQGLIINLLDNALTPQLDNFEIEYDENIIEAISPSPIDIPCVMKNEPFNCFFFFKENVKIEDINTNVKMKYFDSNLN